MRVVVLVLWWTVAVAVKVVEAVELVWHVSVDAWLLDSGCCCLVGALINGGLKLLQELVNIEQITLRASVGEWQSVALSKWGVNTTAAVHVHTAIRAAVERVQKAANTAR